MRRGESRTLPGSRDQDRGDDFAMRGADSDGNINISVNGHGVMAKRGGRIGSYHGDDDRADPWSLILRTRRSTGIKFWMTMGGRMISSSDLGCLPSVLPGSETFPFLPSP